MPVFVVPKFAGDIQRDICAKAGAICFDFLNRLLPAFSVETTARIRHERIDGSFGSMKPGSAKAERGPDAYRDNHAKCDWS